VVILLVFVGQIALAVHVFSAYYYMAN